MSNKRRRATWTKQVKDTAETTGLTETQVEEILNELPYSEIPNLNNVQRLVQTLTNQGWTKPTVTKT